MTEKNYYNALVILKENFLCTMVAIGPEDKKIVFQNIGELEQVHKELFKGLLESLKDNSSMKKVGDIFLEFKERYIDGPDYTSSQWIPDQICLSFTGF